MMENQSPERKASASANINVNNQDKTINKTLHSRKSLLNTLAKVSKHTPYHKNQYSIEDYHLFAKNDIFYDKIEKKTIKTKSNSQESNINFPKSNEIQEVRNFTSSLKPIKSYDKSTGHYNKREGENQSVNEENFNPQTIYSNYGNFGKNDKIKNNNIQNSKNNENSISLMTTFIDHTQTFNFPDVDFLKPTKKKDNQDFNLNNSDFLEEKEIYEFTDDNKHESSLSKTLINKLNKLNNIDLIIERVSDIPFDEEFIQGDEIRGILKRIFMEYAKYSQSENDYLITFQSIITILKAVNIVNDQIIKYSEFGVFFTKQVGNWQKIKFEAFLDIIVKIAFRLFHCFASDPEKCVYFLVKSHFELIFNKGKVNLYLETIRKNKNRNFPIDSSALFAAASNPNYDDFDKNKKVSYSKSLPPKGENYKNQGYNEATQNSSPNININKNNKNFSKKIKYDLPSESNLAKNVNNNYNDIHSNFDNQINSQFIGDEKEKVSNISNFNLTNMTLKDLENWIRITQVDMKTKILINSITPTLLVLYKAYFEQEIKRTFTKLNVVKKSTESLVSFCKDFLILPNYLSFNIVNNYFTIVCSESNAFDHLFKNEVFSKDGFFKIQDFENDQDVYRGVYFTFYKFCITLIHFGLLMFPKLQRRFITKANQGNKTQSNITSTNFSNTTKEFLYDEKDKHGNSNNHAKDIFANYSTAEKILIFLEYLEESKGFKLAEKKLIRTNSANLTFIPTFEVINIIKQKPEAEKRNESFASIAENIDESEHDSNENKKENVILGDFKNIDNIDKHKSKKDMKIREILNPAVKEKTFLKLENWLGRLREIFLFYSISYEKINIDKMNLSCFTKFLKDTNLISDLTNTDSSRIFTNVNNNSLKGINSNMSMNKTFNKENEEKIFNSRILGECIVPKKVETVLTFQKYNEKLAKKMQKISRENSLISNNANNTNSNRSFLSNNNFNQMENSSDNLTNDKANKKNRTCSNDKKNKSALNADGNPIEQVENNFINESFLGESIDLSINNNNNVNNNTHSRDASENNILLMKNNSHNLNANTVNRNSKCIEANQANKASMNSNLNDNYNNRKDNENKDKSFNNTNGNFNKTTNTKFNNKEFGRNGIPENEISVVFFNLVGKKNYDIRKLNKFEKSNNEMDIENEKSLVNEKKNILKNASLNQQKLNFNLFVKALEIIAEKLYGNVSFENGEGKSAAVDVNKCFEKFIEFNIPIIYNNFTIKYKDHQKFKNSEIAINQFLDQIQQEEIASLVRDMQEFVKIFFFNYCDKYGLITFENAIRFLKDFNFYPMRINLLFIKNLFGHYSELFNTIVNNFKDGAIDLSELERKGRLNHVRDDSETNFNILDDEFVFLEIKKLLLIENRMNLLLFNQFLSIVSLKIKADSKVSDFEKAFYIYEKMASYEDIIKKILMKNGKTFNSGLDYKNYLRIVKENYSDCFRNDLHLKIQLDEESIKFSNLFRK